MSTSTEMDTNIEEITSNVNPTGRTRRVRFPSDESQLRMISIAPEPFSNQPLLSLGVILQRYRAACQRLQIRPLNSIVEQLATMEDFRRSFDDRLLSLKLNNEKLDVKQIDAIEEILSRSRFHLLDLESSVYDEATLIQLLDVIEYYETCSHLNLSNQRSIGAQAYQALTRYLRRTRCLERLDMNSVRFDDTNMFSFGRALRLASTLYELHVESCQLNGKMLQKFIQNLRACPTLRELYLCDNRLQVQDAPLLNELIRSCGQNLRLLDLRSNILQDSGIAHLSSQFSQYDENHKQQNFISHLSFQSNQITQNGISFLGKCLIHNRTIRSLNLSQNNLTNEGLYILRDALLSNRTITELMLRNCRLTDQAAIALAEYIAESTTIQYIDLSENNIQISGICGLAIAMKSNRSLLRLDVDSVGSTLINSNVDRSTNNQSLLSFSGFRRMTTGFGSLSNNSTLKGNGTTINEELIEQKTRWINDINAICERNTLFYEEKLKEKLDSENEENPKVSPSQTEKTVVFEIENPTNEELPSEDVFKTVPTDSHSNLKTDGAFTLEENLKINSIAEFDEKLEKNFSSNLEENLETNSSPEINENLEKNDGRKPDENFQKISERNADDAEILLETNPNEIELEISQSTEKISNGENENDGEETQTKNVKLRHSDSLYLLRKKNQIQTDEIIEVFSSKISNEPEKSDRS